MHIRNMWGMEAGIEATFANESMSKSISVNFSERRRLYSGSGDLFHCRCHGGHRPDPATSVDRIASQTRSRHLTSL